MALRDEILAGNFDLQARDDGAIAAALSVGRTKLVETRIGYDTVMATLGANEGAAVLDTLDALSASNSPVKWAMKLLDRGELDMANEQTRLQLDVLAAGGVLTTEQATKMKALAVVDDPYSVGQISDELNRMQAEGVF